MNESYNHSKFSLTDAFVAYCLAVTTSTIAFTLSFGSISLLQSGFKTAITNVSPTKVTDFISFAFLTLTVGWVVAFITSFIPFCIAIVVARKFAITHWLYYVGGSLVTAAAVCIFHARVAQAGPPLGPVPDHIMSLAESYLHYCPYYWLSGSLAGLVCWLYLRKVQSRGR